MSDDLIDRVVAPDILTDDHDLAGSSGEGRRVEPARATKHTLALAHVIR
ncbi:unannotated protein [freshwater metagenome]|uniref:Unannotated protein n=1 Tax=freshwater metagenome TaxID=449393 RepID=A0A6J7BY51_9ZZZZ